MASTLTDDELKIFNTVLADNAHIAKSDEQKQAIRQIYDAPNGPVCSETVHGELAAYLALLHIAGPMAQGVFYPDSEVDTFTAWNAAPPHLREYLRREGSRIVCPQLATDFPWAATDTKANGCGPDLSDARFELALQRAMLRLTQTKPAA